MLFWICLIQIIVYLLIAPYFMVLLDSSREYFFSASIIFTLTYIFGASLKKNNRNKLEVERIEFRNAALLFFALFAILYSCISIKHGLYNRRIGTEEIAVLFSGIPFYEVIAFRIYEVVLPLVLSLIFLIWSLNKKTVANDRLFIRLILVFFFISVSILLSGVLNSRSQFAILLLSMIVICQNSIPRAALRKYVKLGAVVGIFIAASVSLKRFLSIDDLSTEYLIAEFITRLDGLELISRLASDQEISWTGINFLSLMVPLIASMPFLPEAIELKAQALTTIKANILFLEYNSVQRDVNSFVVLDIYYIAGLFGLAFAGSLIGFSVRWVDSNVLASKGLIKFSLATAMTFNLIILEREFISIFLGILRDWLILYFFCFISIRKIYFRSKVSY